MSPPRRTGLTFVAIGAILIAVAGCSKRDALVAPADESSAAFSSRAAAAAPRDAGAWAGPYRRIWPHEDGRGWTFDLTSRIWHNPPLTFYPSPEDAPALTIDDAIRLLGEEIVGGNPDVSTGTYGLQFDGVVTTLSGVTRQNLKETLTSNASGRSVLATASAEASFLRLLYRARPDLMKKAGLSAQSLAPTLAGNVYQPTLLHGYAWEQSAEWIGTYGDLNQRIAWIFLTPDLKPGAEFTLQLVPDLADDVFLHGRVLGWKTVTTGAGVFHHALDVVYLIDFGLGTATNDFGDVIGYFRSYMYGTVDYVAGVGPVRSYERLQLVFDPLRQGDSDLTVSLSASLNP